MKNQLGSAFGSLIQAAEPVLLRLISLVAMAANALSQFFSARGGSSTFLKAKDVFKGWADTAAGGAAATTEWKNQLMGFDEINRLEDQSAGGGGGGGGLNPFDAFDPTPLSDWAQKIADFAAKFKINVKDVFFDWDDLTGEQIAKKVIAGLAMLTGAGIGFMIGGVPGALVGTVVGLTIGLVADSLIFNNKGAID